MRLETFIFCYFSCLTVKAKNNEINHDDDDDNDDEDDDFFNIYIFYIEDAWIGIKWGGGRGVGVGWGANWTALNTIMPLDHFQYFRINRNRYWSTQQELGSLNCGFVISRRFFLFTVFCLFLFSPLLNILL